jgi:hypothetical protein
MEDNQVIENASYYYYGNSDYLSLDEQGNRKVNAKFYTCDGDLITTVQCPYTQVNLNWIQKPQNQR